MIEPLVSICCITYNHVKYIAQAIEGFLMQKTDFPIEILIHDDASTDNTANIVREYAIKYPDLILPIFQKENQYSKGIKPSPTYVWPKARGKYIALCEGDDYWTDPYKLQKQVDFLEANPDFVICFHRVRIINELKQKEYFRPSKPLNRSVFCFEDLIQENILNTPSVIMRNNEVISNLPKEFNNIPTGDWLIWLLMSLQGKIKYLPDCMAVYRVHSTGAWSGKKQYSSVENHLKLLNIIEPHLNEDKKISVKKEKIIRLFYLFRSNFLRLNFSISKYYLNELKKITENKNMVLLLLDILYKRIMSKINIFFKNRFIC